MISLQHHQKVLIIISDLQNPTINPQTLTRSIITTPNGRISHQALTRSISLCQTVALAFMSISNLIYKGSPTMKQHIYRWKRYKR
jgi:hypothetical protein